VPCDRAQLCNEISEELIENAPKISENPDTTTQNLRENEISMEVIHVSLFEHDISTDWANKSILYMKDRGIGEKFGAYLVQEALRPYVDRALIEILPGVETIYLRYGNQVLPKAYSEVIPERLTLKFSHLSELFIIYAVCVALAIVCFSIELGVFRFRFYM
jgi:hypothetical protein